MFNVVLVLKCLPFEKESLLGGSDDDGDLSNLRKYATIVYDDRAPDEDAGYWYGINHARGAVVAVRPDLWVGTSCWPEEEDVLRDYFAGFLVEKEEQRASGVGGVNGMSGANGIYDTDGLKDYNGLQLPGYEPNREISVTNGVGRYVDTSVSERGRRDNVIA